MTAEPLLGFVRRQHGGNLGLANSRCCRGRRDASPLTAASPRGSLLLGSRWGAAAALPQPCFKDRAVVTKLKLVVLPCLH